MIVVLVVTSRSMLVIPAMKVYSVYSVLKASPNPPQNLIHFKESLQLQRLLHLLNPPEKLSDLEGLPLVAVI